MFMTYHTHPTCQSIFLTFPPMFMTYHTHPTCQSIFLLTHVVYPSNRATKVYRRTAVQLLERGHDKEDALALIQRSRLIEGKR